MKGGGVASVGRGEEFTRYEIQIDAIALCGQRYPLPRWVRVRERGGDGAAALGGDNVLYHTWPMGGGLGRGPFAGSAGLPEGVRGPRKTSEGLRGPWEGDICTHIRTYAWM